MSTPRYTDAEIANLAMAYSKGQPKRMGDFALHIFRPATAISPQCMQITRAIRNAGGKIEMAEKRTDSIFTI